MPTESGQVETLFSALDWAVLAGYGLLLLLTGIWWNRRQRDTEDYFLAGRSMPAWAVSFSVIATAISAASFIGGPQQSYAGDLTYASANLGAILGVVVVALVFIPQYYRYNIATVYEIMGIRFGQPARTAAAMVFLAGRVLADGVRVYIAAIPLSLIMFGHAAEQEPMRYLGIAIACLTTVGILYTFIGGIASIIWTDVIQTLVFVAALIAAFVLLLHRIPVTGEEIVAALRTTPGVSGASKLTVISPGLDRSEPFWGFDMSAKFTLLTAVLGWSIFNAAAYGTDHVLAQRMLTCKSAGKGSLSALFAIVLNVPIVLLLMSVGLLLYVFYQRPDLMGAAAPTYTPNRTEYVFLDFILKEMPSGLSGLMIAGIFAAALSTINGSLNSMASAFVNDCYKVLQPKRDEGHYLRVGRLGVLAAGIVVGAFAMYCAQWYRSLNTALAGEEAHGKTLIEFALGVMTFAYAGLLAAFATALFTKRGNNISIIAGLIVGFVCVLALQRSNWDWICGWGIWGGRLKATPGDKAFTLGDLRNLADTWRLLIGTGLALCVCLMGKGRAAPASAETAASDV